MRIKEFVQEAVMSVGLQSKYPISPGARSLMASRWRYDTAVKQNVQDSNTNALNSLEHNLKHIPQTDYESIDAVMQGLSEKFRIDPADLHRSFVKKFNCTPDQYAVNYKKSRQGQPVKI